MSSVGALKLRGTEVEERFGCLSGVDGIISRGGDWITVSSTTRIESRIEDTGMDKMEEDLSILADISRSVLIFGRFKNNVRIWTGAKALQFTEDDRESGSVSWYHLPTSLQQKVP